MKFSTTVQSTTSQNVDKILSEKLERIIKAIHFYSNTSGIKHCGFSFIADGMLRKEIQPFANNNINITEAKCLLLFYTWNKLPSPEINISSNPVIEKIHDSVPHENFRLNVQNTYQAMDAGLKMAAVENVNAFLIEDLHYDQIDSLLHLKQTGLRSVAFLALSYNEPLPVGMRNE